MRWRPREWDSCPYETDLRELPWLFHQEDDGLESRKQAPTRHQVCQCPDIGLPSLQRSEAKFPVVYKPPSLCFLL